MAVYNCICNVADDCKLFPYSEFDRSEESTPGQLKDQLAWIGRMNSIRQRADEIILAELIYG